MLAGSAAEPSVALTLVSLYLSSCRSGLRHPPVLRGARLLLRFIPLLRYERLLRSRVERLERLSRGMLPLLYFFVKKTSLASLRLFILKNGSVTAASRLARVSHSKQLSVRKAGRPAGHAEPVVILNTGSAGVSLYGLKWSRSTHPVTHPGFK